MEKPTNQSPLNNLCIVSLAKCILCIVCCLNSTCLNASVPSTEKELSDAIIAIVKHGDLSDVAYVSMELGLNLYIIADDESFHEEATQRTLPSSLYGGVEYNLTIPNPSDKIGGVILKLNTVYYDMESAIAEGLGLSKEQSRSDEIMDAPGSSITSYSIPGKTPIELSFRSSSNMPDEVELRQSGSGRLHGNVDPIGVRSDGKDLIGAIANMTASGDWLNSHSAEDQLGVILFTTQGVRDEDIVGITGDLHGIEASGFRIEIYRTGDIYLEGNGLSSLVAHGTPFVEIYIPLDRHLVCVDNKEVHAAFDRRFKAARRVSYNAPVKTYTKRGDKDVKVSINMTMSCVDKIHIKQILY